MTRSDYTQHAGPAVPPTVNRPRLPPALDRAGGRGDGPGAVVDAVSAWLPIESAPKDAGRIMLSNEFGAWMADWRPVYQSGFRPDNPWASAMLNHDHIPPVGRYRPATHWQPIPEPPK